MRTPVRIIAGVAILCCGWMLLCGFRSNPALFFTDDEQLWLENNQPIRVGVFPWFPPVIFEDREAPDRQIAGLAPDYLHRIAEIHKLPVELVQFNSKEAAWQALLAGEIDLVPAMESTPEVRTDALFTSPYITRPSVIISRNSEHGTLTEADMISGNKSVGIVANSPAYFHLAPRYPDLQLQTVPTVKDGLSMVSSGKLDALIIDDAEAGHHLSEIHAGNLHIVGETEHALRIAMATNQRNPELRDIIDRALDTLLPETHSQIQNRWTMQDGERGVSWESIIIWGIVILLLLVVIAAIIGSAMLRRKVRQRTRELLETVEECKKTQEQLSESFAEAQRLTHQLQEGNLTLLELSEQKSEFLGILTHDLKSPLTSILQTIQLYLSSDQSPSTELKECFSQIEAIASGAISTIEEMVTIDALESNQLRVNPERLDIASLARDVIQTLTPQAKAKSISIIASCPDSLEARFDYRLMFMAVENIIGNAIKFSPPGSSVWVTLTRLEKAGLTRIDIKDEGPGLTEEDLKRLFSKFARLSAKPTAGESSTGLGLAITRKILDFHEGSIRAANCEGKGAVFTIEF